MKFISLLIFTLFLNAICFSQAEKNCSLMKNGTFKYLEPPDTSAYFVITDSTHTEFFGQGTYFIKSEMVWLSSCRYALKMTENTVPNFPFKPGDVMTVTINKIEDDIVYYTSEVNGQKWQARVRKLK